MPPLLVGAVRSPAGPLCPVYLPSGRRLKRTESIQTHPETSAIAPNRPERITPGSVASRHIRFDGPSVRRTILEKAEARNCPWTFRRFPVIQRGELCAGAVVMLLSMASGTGLGADWPRYRADVARSAAAAQSLRFPLCAAWVYEPAQPPRPAWPDAAWGEGSRRDRDRIEIDDVPRPVVAHGMVYFGSSADDTVRALDLATGQLRWRFTTGGPVRFAPDVADGNCYVASDDGFVYCLDAVSGQLIWRFQAAPGHDQLLGNGRMISRWPLRNGVLVDGGTAYVTAGMWPSEGVCVYALDADTGRVIWCNDTSDNLYVMQPHHGYALAGVAPQGYLLASGDVLLVPTGRALPAGYDRATGRLLYLRHAAKGGGVWATIDERDGLFFNGHQGQREGILAYSLRDGELVPDAKAGFVADGCVRAGETLVEGKQDLVTAVSDGKEVWRYPVRGRARGIAVAGGRLVVATTEGLIYCFRPLQGDAPERTPGGGAIGGDRITPGG